MDSTARMTNHSVIRTNIDGFDTEIVVYNPGRNSVLVGLHGFAGNAFTFRRLVRYLPDNVTFYSISLPWHGDTKCTDGSKLLDLETYGDALAAWIRSLQVSDVSIMAHSFGARVSSVMAIRHPRLSRQLFYLAPGGFYFPEDVMFRFMAVQPFRYISTFDFALRPYARFMIPRMKSEQEPAILHSLRKIGYSFPKISLRKNGLLKELNTYEGQLWLIMGKKDHLLPHSFGSKILSYWKKAELLTLESSGHLPMADNPKKTGTFIASKLR